MFLDVIMLENSMLRFPQAENPSSFLETLSSEDREEALDWRERHQQVSARVVLLRETSYFPHLSLKVAQPDCSKCTVVWNTFTPLWSSYYRQRS